MLVVADSSPLIVLVNIRQVDVLPKLFGQVVVPPEVTNALGSISAGDRAEPCRAGGGETTLEGAWAYP